MIRLVLLLCAGLYLVAMISGTDHGQKRHGLMLADSQSQSATAHAADPQKSMFIPTQPTIQPIAQPATAATSPATPTLTTPTLTDPVLTQVAVHIPAPQAPTLPQPVIAGGVLYSVTASQANVRAGPGRSFAAIGSLTNGEQVLVVTEAQPIKGWSLIRVEGDGTQGYVSTSLLTLSQ